VGRRPIDDANSAYASGYNVVDAGVCYAHPLKGVATTWRLTVNNIGNAHYWSTLDPGNITGTNVGSYTAHLGQPRTVAASGSLHVCHAGSLLAAFTQVEDEFRKQNRR
jgi:iron complex outermembrane recepter protein